MRRLVIVAPGWLGDAVMALPAIADARRCFQGTELHVAARAAVAPLFEIVPAVDEVVTLPGRGGWSSLLAWRAQAAALGGGRYDAAILLPNSFVSALAVFRAGVPERWGFATDGRARLLTRAVPKARMVGHHAGYYQALMSALDVPAGERYPRVEVSAALKTRARELLEDEGVNEGAAPVVLAPGAAYGRAKQWLPERFAELAGLLTGEGTPVVLVGSGADRAVCAEIARLAGRYAAAAPPRTAHVIDLSGRTDLPTLAGLFAMASACVSNDSGAMHLAAATGTHVVAVFGATDERRTAPLANGFGAPPPRVVSADVWCRPCLLRECPIDHRCMSRVTASRVLEALNASRIQKSEVRSQN